MALHRDLAPDAVQVLEVDLGVAEPWPLVALGHHSPPWVRHQRVAIGCPVLVVLPGLGGRHHVALALNGSGTQQNLPGMWHYQTQLWRGQLYPLNTPKKGVLSSLWLQGWFLVGLDSPPNALSLWAW